MYARNPVCRQRALTTLSPLSPALFLSFPTGRATNTTLIKLLPHLPHPQSDFFGGGGGGGVRRRNRANKEESRTRTSYPGAKGLSQSVWSQRGPLGYLGQTHASYREARHLSSAHDGGVFQINTNEDKLPNISKISWSAWERTS